MIDPERLKPFLLHEDRFVREAAAEYFADSWSPDPDLIPLLLQACRRWGPGENGRALSYADHFRPTEAGLAEVLDYLPQFTDRWAADQLNNILVHAPPELLAPKEAALRSTANVQPETLTRLEQRWRLARKSADELWRDVLAFVERMRDVDEVEEKDVEYADDLTEVLIPRDVPDAATVCRILAGSKEDYSWLPNFLVDLAGGRRLRAAVPTLVDFLEIDAESLLEQTTEALAKIGDPEAVRLIRARFPRWSWDARLYGSEVLGDIKHPDAEDALIALLEQTKQADIRAWLAVALYKQLSERALDVLRRVVHTAYDRSITHLDEDLVTLADILGAPLPEIEKWRAKRAENWRKIREREAEFAGWSPSNQAATAAESPAADESRDEGQSEPFVHAGERVGRNDPCPCGSGKKFKKCCGQR
jgi:HEAT repeat protein